MAYEIEKWNHEGDITIQIFQIHSMQLFDITCRSVISDNCTHYLSDPLFCALCSFLQLVWSNLHSNDNGWGLGIWDNHTETADLALYCVTIRPESFCDLIYITQLVW